VRRQARALVERHEGRRQRLYRCTAGKLTIGVGWNIEDRGLPNHIIDALLEYTLDGAAEDLDVVIPNWRTMSVRRQVALLDWSVQLGRVRMTGFRRAVVALRSEQYSTAAREMRDSTWARQVPSRAATITQAIEEG
jgi:lysozyme